MKHQRKFFKYTEDFNMLGGTVNLTTLATILAAEVKNNKQNEKQIKSQKLKIVKYYFTIFDQRK